MVAVEEEKFEKIILPNPPQPLVKPIDLRNVGVLQNHSMIINCPSCLAEALSVVRLEVVTCWQKFLRATNIRKTSESRCDINHYCGICGCYIGRYVAIGCVERCISKQAREKAANDAMTLKTKPRDCAEDMQKARERVKQNLAKEKTKKSSGKIDKKEHE